MKNTFKYLLAIIVLLTVMNSCTKTDYTMGDLTAPSNLAITTVVVGQDATHPNGDGSGDVMVTVSAENALSYKVDYDANTPVDWAYIPTGKVTKKFTGLGVKTYTITALVYGKGGTSSTITKDVTVRFDYIPAPQIVADLTGGSSKTWAVDGSLPGQLGVGPWVGSYVPEWWAAAPGEKVACCNCFYTARFTFTKVVATGTYSLQVATPDGAFTKTGSLAGGLPGIPASGAEGCYAYAGGTSSFSFLPSSTGTTASTPSTRTAIDLAGTNTFIGYGAVLKTYEIMVITPTYLYLRVQGTETGNAWYIKLKPI